ncbi:MAG: UDP-N-acetylmuramoyl-L-alanyl-D-glutamate--2,6-diaminopimelate ligase [Acidimicrobiia bacterium]|nr:UDP-N-acetylmuramoyl-L-alanyl-D-glutamate--2,6-diaminopimelate ligase [Acidimicrobiia bacterium]
MASVAELAEVCDGTLHAGRGDGVEVPIVDASHDSHAIQPGWLYCCVPGSRVDGHDFAGAAVEAGAVALLVERVLEINAVPQIVVPSTRAAMGPVASAIHNHPSSAMTVIGVTGTNGKSSIVQLLADIFSHVGRRAEIVGTLMGARTTPEATDLQRLLAAARNNGCDMVAVEVSSHALDMGRVDGTRFASAIFTNLGRDHLDYHHTIDAYFEAKARLFTDGFTDHAVVNIDDPYGRRLVERIPDSVTVDTYSLDKALGLRFDGPTSLFRWDGHDVVLPLAGAHNVSNALGAATAALTAGIPIERIVAALEKSAPVRGRFELVSGGQPFHVAIDYAHTPDAMQSALTAARQVAGPNRVLVVFGCGGDRDAQKRPEMGRVAERGADVAIVTSDNPRSEDPDAIIAAVVEGFETPRAALVEPDRRRAIEAALRRAETGDVVLIAGKGHETYQEIGEDRLRFDDAEVAREILEALA